MERMTLGRTGLEAYRLGFGGIPIQRVSESEAVETVCHAIQCGVDFIDTSRAYTTSERRIGLALKQTDNGVILASKSQGKTADAARADLEMSLKEFQRDYIDLYQCHFVSTGADYQTVISRGGALEALQRAKEEGLIGHIGITGHSLDVLDRAIDDGLFDTIMVCLSFLEPDARNEVIPKAIAKNIGVIAMKPFSGGVIENARLALKYALAVPGVLVVPGAEHPELFDEDWAVFQDPDPLTEAEKCEIAAIQQRYDKAFCRRCDYCQPCSEGIPIQMVLGLRSMVKRVGVRSPLFGEAVVKARNCSECGECLPRCPYGLPIPDLIRENLRWFDETLGVTGRST
jgi:uncharacterized protein